MLKKKVWGVVVLLLVSMLLLSACGSQSASVNADQTPPDLSAYQNGDIFITPQELKEKLGDPNVETTKHLFMNGQQMLLYQWRNKSNKAKNL